MSFMRFAPVLLAFAIAFSGAGCAARQSPGTSPQGYAGNRTNILPQGYTGNRMNVVPQGFTAPYTTGPNAMVKNAGRNVMPPKQLNVIHSNALGLMTDAEKKDWAAAQSKMKVIRTNYDQLRPLMQASSVPTNRMNNLRNAISALEKQVSAKNSYATRVEANRVTRTLPDITDTYRATTPTNLSRLGYLGREMSLNVEKNDWRNAGINYNAAKTMWTSMGKQLGLTSNPGSTNLSSSLENVGRAIASKSATNAKAGIKGLSNALTSLESYFTKMGQGK